MNFTFISLFPEIIRSSLNESITKRAIEKSLISFETINPRDYLKTKERIDDKVYGGGPGMLLKSEPLMKAIDDATSKFDRSKSKIIYLSPKGKPFTQKIAESLASERNIIFISVASLKLLSFKPLITVIILIVIFFIYSKGHRISLLAATTI